MDSSSIFKSLKIPKISNSSASASVSSSASSTPEIIINRLNSRHIFKGRTVLFIGDASVRSIYRDLCQLLLNGRFLRATEAAQQHGEYQPLEGETRLVSGGTRGMTNYVDIRKFHYPTSSITLIYIFIATLFDSSVVSSNLSFLKEFVKTTSIHIAICSTYHSDMNFAKLSKLETSFQIRLDDYKKNLKDFLQSIKMICRSTDSIRQHFVWLTPFPPASALSDLHQQQFDQIYENSYTIAKDCNFGKFDRYYIWRVFHDNKLLFQSNNFSSRAQKIGLKYNRPLGSSSLSSTITMRPTPLQIQEAYDRSIALTFNSKEQSRTVKRLNQRKLK